MNAETQQQGSGPGNGLPEKSVKKGLLIGAIFAGVGLVLLGVTSFVWWQERSFLARAEHTRGLVVAMSTQWGGTGGSNRRSDNKPTYAPTFTFADRAGNEHRVDSHSGTNPPSYRVGESVDVFYDPEKPDNAQLRGFFSQWGAVTICGGLGLGFTLIGGLVASLAAARSPHLIITGQ